MKDSLLQSKKRIPIVRQTDVIVAGGGFAGIAAALAAARNGAKVTLVEKEWSLGGLGTLGLITIFLPICDGNGHQVTSGITEELLRLSVLHGYETDHCTYPEAWLNGKPTPDKDDPRFKVQYNPHLFALEAEKLLLAEGVEICYGSMVCDVVNDGNVIRYLLIENKSGRQALEAKSFIDCTGDADLCEMSLAQTKRFQQGNLLAGWYYSLTDGELRLNMVGASDIPDKYKNHENDKEDGRIRYSGIDADDLSRQVQDSHRWTLELILKRQAKHAQHIPVTSPGIPQVRMTRRLVGNTTLDDTHGFSFDGDGGGIIHREDNFFPDCIGLVGDWRKSGPVHEIPFSCLYSNSVPNLITAGRCISVTDAMWDITRVIPVCTLTGEAAGTAAAMRQAFNELDVRALQKQLEKRGNILRRSQVR